MLTFLISLYRVVLNGIFLGPVMWAGWNFGLRELFKQLPYCELFPVMVVVVAWQVYQGFALHKVVKEIIPVSYVPYDKNEDIDDKDVEVE